MKTIKNRFATVLFATMAVQIHTASAAPGKAGAPPAQGSTGAGTQLATDVARAPELPLLRREAGSLTAAAATLKGVFCEKGCSASRLPDGVRLSSASWRLDLTGDGSSVDFLDSEVASRAHALRRDTSERTSATALEAAGRKVIAEKLAGVLPLGQGEELYRVAVDYRSEGGQAPGGEVTTAWTGSRVLFGRKIQGVPLVGGGSTIAVTFANDGSLESFHYDWAAYTVTEESMPILPMGNILSLVQTAVAERSGTAPGATPLLAPSEANPGPIDLSPTAQLERLECGFYDPGQVNRDASAPVQAGCYYHAISVQKVGDVVTRAGYAGAIPASSEVLPDASWPEAAALTSVQMSAPPAAAPRSKLPSP